MIVNNNTTQMMVLNCSNGNDYQLLNTRDHKAMHVLLRI